MMVQYFSAMRSVIRKWTVNKILNSQQNVIIRKPYCNTPEKNPKKSIFNPSKVKRTTENTTFWYREIWTQEFLSDYKECLPIYIGCVVALIVDAIVLTRLALTRDDVCYTKRKWYEGVNYDWMHPKVKRLTYYFQRYPPNPQLCRIYCDMREAQKELDKKEKEEAEAKKQKEKEEAEAKKAAGE